MARLKDDGSLKENKNAQEAVIEYCLMPIAKELAEFMGKVGLTHPDKLEGARGYTRL